MVKFVGGADFLDGGTKIMAPIFAGYVVKVDQDDRGPLHCVDVESEGLEVTRFGVGDCNAPPHLV